MPKGADQLTEKGLIRATVYYFDDLADHLHLTGDAEPLLTYCPRSVELCAGFAEHAASLHNARRYYVVGNVSFSEIDIYDVSVEGRPAKLFDAILRAEPSQVRHYGGDLLEQRAGSILRFRAVLEYTDGVWQVRSAAYERIRLLP